MPDIRTLPRVSLGLYPTPLVRLESVSRACGRGVWIKRDDLCGVALGGNKVRKLEFLLADAQAQGCDVVFTTGGAQSNHAMLTAACAARLGMRAILILKKRGVTEHLGNLVLDDLYGAEVRLMDTDSYDDIYAEMRRVGGELERQGRKCYYIPCGGSNALGAVGYVRCAEELARQADARSVRFEHIVSATGSGGTTAGLLLGARLFMPQTRVTGVEVDTDPFEQIVPALAQECAALLGCTLDRAPDDFGVYRHVGAGYAIPNPEDTPVIQSLARNEGILLDPVYTGKAFAGMLQLLQTGGLRGSGDVVFVHTGGAAALFAMDLPVR